MPFIISLHSKWRCDKNIQAEESNEAHAEKKNAKENYNFTTISEICKRKIYKRTDLT